MQLTTIVFLGPSLPRDVARAILPDAIVLPPARQADVLSAVENHRPAVIALIDGLFGQSLSVWHKEILFAMERRVRVYGAASIGALRAAELAPFGMVGVGQVYEMYARGDLIDDDEVALVHAHADDGFRAQSEPMVNLRSTFNLACSEGVLTPAETDLLIATAKRLHFSDRQWPTILATALDNGLSTLSAARVRSFAATRYSDLKGRDAQLLLETIRDLPDPLPMSSPPAVPLARSAFFERLYHNDRRVSVDGVNVPLRSISAYAALNLPEFDALNFAAMNRALVLVLASMLGVEVTPAEVDQETRRFRHSRALESDAALSTWLESHHLGPEGFEALMRELATCRRLQRWLLSRDRQAQRTRWVLDELRIADQYRAVAAAAADQERVLGAWDSDDGSGDLSDDLDLDVLVASHARATNWRVHAPLPLWAEEAGFATAQDLALELHRAQRVRARLLMAARALAGGATSRPA